LFKGVESGINGIESGINGIESGIDGSELAFVSQIYLFMIRKLAVEEAPECIIIFIKCAANISMGNAIAVIIYRAIR
jgi:hypothetical protein